MCRDHSVRRMMWPNTSWQWQVVNNKQQLLKLGSCVERQLQLERLRLDIGKNSFTERNMQHWNKFPSQAAELPSLVVSNTQLDKATADLA